MIRAGGGAWFIFFRRRAKNFLPQTPSIFARVPKDFGGYTFKIRAGKVGITIILLFLISLSNIKLASLLISLVPHFSRYRGSALTPPHSFIRLQQNIHVRGAVILLPYTIFKLKLPRETTGPRLFYAVLRRRN